MNVVVLLEMVSFSMWLRSGDLSFAGEHCRHNQAKRKWYEVEKTFFWLCCRLLSNTIIIKALQSELKMPARFSKSECGTI